MSVKLNEKSCSYMVLKGSTFVDLQENPLNFNISESPQLKNGWEKKIQSKPLISHYMFSLSRYSQLAARELESISISVLLHSIRG